MKRSEENKSKGWVFIFFAGIFLFTVCVGMAFYFLYLPKKYTESVEKYAREYGVESDLVYAVIRCESSFDKNAVSKSGAVGLMQILPETAEYIIRISGRNSAYDLSCAEDNIEVGVLYLNYLKNRFYSETEILAAYNAGEGRVNSWLSDPKYSEDGISLSDIPFKETREYVKRVKKFYNYYKFFYF